MIVVVEINSLFLLALSLFLYEGYFPPQGTAGY
jgi:hypothetical protein